MGQVNHMTEGLSSVEAARRLRTCGPNEVPERRRSRWLAFALQFWAHVPWMLEAAVFLTVVLGRETDALIIFFLLVFNGVVSS